MTKGVAALSEVLVTLPLVLGKGLLLRAFSFPLTLLGQVLELVLTVELISLLPLDGILTGRV